MPEFLPPCGAMSSETASAKAPPPDPHVSHISIRSSTSLIIGDCHANCHRFAGSQYGKLSRFTYPQKSKPVGKVCRIPHKRSVNFSHHVTWLQTRPVRSGSNVNPRDHRRSMRRHKFHVANCGRGPIVI